MIHRTSFFLIPLFLFQFVTLKLLLTNTRRATIDSPLIPCSPLSFPLGFCLRSVLVPFFFWKPVWPPPGPCPAIVLSIYLLIWCAFSLGTCSPLFDTFIFRYYPLLRRLRASLVPMNLASLFFGSSLQGPAAPFPFFSFFS